MITKVDIIDQLLDIYFTKEVWHNHLPKDIARRYFTKLYNSGNILVELDEESVAGYLEIWALDEKQAMRIVNGDTFHAESENISDGHICYVANIYVEEAYRKKDIVKKLRAKAEYIYIGCRAVLANRAKYNNRIRVFKRR